MKKKKIFKNICLVLMTILLAAGSFPSAAAVSATPPSYLKSVTYVSDAWVINFWNTESDHMEEELAQIAADGFNSIILVIPWREFQPRVVPVAYNDYAFRKLDQVMRAAEAQGLWVELRVSYTWDYYESGESLTRFKELLGNNQMREGWLAYIKKIYETASGYSNFYGGFMTWEDFWNYMADASEFGTGTNSRAEAERIGYQAYLEKYYTLAEVNAYYKSVKEFISFRDIYIPQRTNPAYKLLFEFYDDYLIGLLNDAQQVFPNLSMEVRLDVDPVNGIDGGDRVGAHHFRTFPCGNSSYTSLMYSVSMGQVNNGEKITAAAALAAADSQLNVVKTYNGGKPIFIDQLLYMDGTEQFSYNAQLLESERNQFITSLPGILRKYTNGYGIWCYRNYANSPVYNSQFALNSRGWDTNRAEVVNRDGSNQMKMEGSGKIVQKIGDRIAGKFTHGNHVSFTVDSDGPATLSVTLGKITKQVSVNGKGEFDLNFGQLEYSDIEFRSNGELYLDNVVVYNFIQDGQLYDMANQELSCLDAVRALNAAMN